MKISKLTILSILLFSCSSEPTQETVNIEVESDTLAMVEDDSTIAQIEEEVDIDTTVYEVLTFGYANETGDTLLQMNKEDGPQPEEFKYAINKEGTISKIAYIGKQESGQFDTHRDNHYNFNNAEGQLYEMKEGLADEWNTTLFLTEEFRSNRTILKAEKESSKSLSNSQISQIEERKQRTIKKSELSKSYGEKGSLYFLEFEKEKDSCLVSIVWVREQRFTYLDFPAKYDEMSTWRVDDGGEFYFEYYHIIAVFESENGIEIMTDWVGAEGSSINYLLARGDKFESVGGAYRYQAPM